MSTGRFFVSILTIVIIVVIMSWSVVVSTTLHGVSAVASSFGRRCCSLLCTTTDNNRVDDCLIVKRNVLPTETFARLYNRLVSNEVRGLVLDGHGRKRKALCPVEYKDVYESLNHLVDGYELNMYIDYRVYPLGSNGMGWHRDVRVMHGDYYEAVLTLWNDSDSVFEYIHKEIPTTQKPDSIFTKKAVRRLLTNPNTLVMVKPEGVMHRVTPVRRGSRVILKCVYTPVIK